MVSMKILIIGGTGFIGRKVSEKLSQRHHIYILSRQSQSIENQLPFDATIINKTEISRLSSLDAVINLMGEPVAQRWTEKLI